MASHSQEISTLAVPSAEVLEWDSNFFGFRIGRIKLERLAPDNWGEILAWVQDNRIDCLYFLADSADFSTIRCVERLGFQLVDIRISMEKQVIGSSSQDDSELTIRPANENDIPELKVISGHAFRRTRFYNDGHFPAERCKQLYEVWIEKSCSGYADIVFVAEQDKASVGFITCHMDSDGNHAKVGLLAVRDGWQRRGIGDALLSKLRDTLLDAGCSSVSVITQGVNIGAQRAYQKAGFRTKEVKIWYHIWFIPDRNGKDA